jgi:hypothetical protein
LNIVASVDCSLAGAGSRKENAAPSPDFEAQLADRSPQERERQGAVFVVDALKERLLL